MIFVTLATSAFDCQMSMENMRLQMLLCLLDKKERGGLKSLKRNAQQILFLQLAVKPSTHTASVAVVLLIITEGLARVQKKPCVVQYHHSLVLFRYLSFDPFKLLFLLSFLGSRRAIAAQIVNALVGQKKLIWPISKGSKGINFSCGSN